MEDYSKHHAQTTSSNFYDTRKEPAVQDLQSPHELKRSIIYANEVEQNIVPQLQSQMSALEGILQELQDHYDVHKNLVQCMALDYSLDDWHKAKMANIEQIRKQNESIQKEMKDKLQIKFEDLDKELQQNMKRRKNEKMKYEILLREGLDQTRELKEKTFSSINNLKNHKIQQLKKKRNNLKKTCQTFKKSQRKCKNQLIFSLQTIKNRFNERLNVEETKRNQLHNVMTSLLEKTCEKAEKSLRRKLYESKPASQTFA